MKSLATAGLTALCLTAGTAWSAPITFNTALPVHEGGYVLHEQFVFMKIADDPTPARRDMEVIGLVSVLGYGVSRDFALFGVLPWFDKRLDMRIGGHGSTRSEQGFGDLVVLGRYTAFEDNGPGRTVARIRLVGCARRRGTHLADPGLSVRQPAELQAQP